MVVRKDRFGCQVDTYATFSFFLRAVLSHRHSLFIVAALLVLTGAVSTYSYLAYRDAIQFRDNLINRKYEGSLTEDLGFMAALTAEISLGFEESEEEDRRTERIRSSLLNVRSSLEALGLATSELPGPDLPLETVADPAVLLGLLKDHERLASLSIEEIGLTPRIELDLPDRPSLQTAESVETTSSFVFIPSPLVEVREGEIGLPYSVKRDLVLSKLVEPYLCSLAEEFAKDNASQVYFIPVSGFVRIHDPRSKNQVDRYRDAFSAVRSFSDRTYFRETRKIDGYFRRSEPYLDAVGGGLASTYSVYVHNDDLGLVGMIGLDRRLVSMASLWNGITLGLGPLRDFTAGSYNSHLRKSRQEENVAANIMTALAEEIEGNIREFSEDIRRIEIDGTTIFTAPIGGDEIAYFIFEPDQVQRKYALLGAAYLGSLGALGLIAFLIVYFQRASVSSERRQAEIVANLNGGFLIVDDDDDVILAANEKFRTLAGDEHPENKPLARYLTEESLNEYQQHKSRGGFDFAGAIRSGDGTPSPVIISCAPLRSEQSSSSRMLILIPSAELELTIAKKFLHVFSHALKSPVHNIVLIADLFRRKKAFAKFDYYFSLMQNRVQEFTILVDDVVRFSELDMKNVKLDRQPVNVAQGLRRVMSSVRERAAAQNMSLTGNIPESLNLNADADMLRVVFNNLVDNAFKYGAGGEIKIDAADRGSEIVITFSDTGPGVPPEERKKIFDMFFQGRNRKGGSRGLGLGLHVSKRYVDLHGGELCYEPLNPTADGESDSAIPRGSKFTVSLPKSITQEYAG